MWSSTIKTKDFNGSIIEVNVNYSNGSRDFNEVYSLNSLSELDTKIRNKLGQLTSLDTEYTKISLGEYEPPQVVPNPIDTKSQALSELTQLKKLVDLGVIDMQNTAYIDAINLYKSLA